MTSTAAAEQPKPRPLAPPAITGPAHPARSKHRPQPLHQPIAEAGIAAIITRLDELATKLDKLEQLPASIEHLHSDLGTLAETLDRQATPRAPGAHTAGRSHAD